MLRHSLRLAAVTAAALALLAAPATPQKLNRWGQFWGTYLHWVQVGPGLNVLASIALHVDGTVTGSVTSVPDANSRYGAIHGVWQRTGWKEIGATTLISIHNASTGVLIGYQRNRCSLEFNDDFSGYKGREFMETLTCASPLTCPDPLDPATKWTVLSILPPSGFSVSAFRQELVASGPLKP